MGVKKTESGLRGFLVITGAGGSLGFRAAGFDTLEVADDEDMGRLLLTLQAQGCFGLIAVEERFFFRITDRVMKRINKSGLPIIIHINIPSKWEEREVGESPVVRLIRKAIGYQIKIKK
ncbi:MAG: hypothetical protein BMS9Abin23_0501 [Thermodesulfobacteriota bacterium]|nr:MAG: hypothetical protein BMS9Abin23_0501 [Thermodesulfobacteriota bacterium]